MKLKYTISTLSLAAFSSLAFAGENCATGHCDKEITVAAKECSAGHCDKDITVATEKCADGSCDKEIAVISKECANGSCDKEMTVASKECADGSCDKEMAVASKECADGSCDKEIAVASKECADGSCDKEMAVAKGGCDKADAKFVVTGMTCTGCSDKVTATLTAIDGVQVKKACHKSGNVAVNFDEKKTDKVAVLTALKSTGYGVSENLSFPVSGMNCGTCSTKLTAALNAVDGCTVGGICHKSGHATVSIDHAKTSEAKIMEVITSNGYKVGETVEVKTTAITPTKS